MRALVTGSSGFAGGYLVSALEADNVNVMTFDLQYGQDIRNYDQVRFAVNSFEPDLVFHLAAIVWPGESLTDPRYCLDTNITGTLNILEAVRHTGSHARVLVAGTSEEYGYEGHKSDAALNEDTVCRPTTAYGVSKLAATTLAMVYNRRYHVPVVVTRAFNHTGPGRQAVSAESAFARRIVAVERGECDYVRHGDLSAVRDFLDVRDVITAYRAVITAPSSIYNVCSGSPVSLQDVMNVLVGLSTASPRLEEDASLIRRDPVLFPRPSASRLRETTGWSPQIKLEDSLAQLLDYWRNR
jgi:GDP-4-dehydro-6-deoxy-D-mannose reductase